MVKAGFNADYGLFTSTEQGGLAFPQPVSSQLGGSAPALLHFLGAIFGKALYEGILLDTPLAPFFVAKLQGRYPLFDDLQAFDPELHRSLVQLKRRVLLEPDCCWLLPELLPVIASAAVNKTAVLPCLLSASMTGKDIAPC